MPHATLRKVILVLLIAAIIAGAAWAVGTRHGRTLLRHPHALGDSARLWADRHPVVAPLAVMGVFAVCGMLALPVWWISVLGGYVFGIARGTGLCLIGSTLGAVAGAAFIRWLGAEWFHERVEGRMARLARLDEKLGHNGLLVVMALRLLYIAPYGLSNYMFGLSRISLRDVALGTLLGSLPHLVVYVLAGHDPRLFGSVTFILFEASAYVVLLTPLALRYWKPQWFKRMGIE